METTIPQYPVQAESAQTFMLKVRRYTRRKYNAKDKIRIILEGMKQGISVVDPCRKEGISRIFVTTQVVIASGAKQ